MVSAGAAVSEEVANAFVALKEGEDEVLTLELKQPKGAVQLAASVPDARTLFSENVKAALDSNRPRIFVVKINSGEVAIVHLSPDGAKSAGKMKVALSIGPIRGALQSAGLDIRGEYQASDSDDIEYDEFDAWVSKSGHHSRVLSRVEELRVEADQAEAEAAREMEADAAEVLAKSAGTGGSSPMMKSPVRGASTGAAIPFAASSELSEALSAFSAGSVSFVAASVNIKTERLSLVSSE